MENLIAALLQFVELINPFLMPLVVLGTEGLKAIFLSFKIKLNSYLATAITAVVFTAIFLRFDQGIEIIEIIISIMTALVSYSWVYKPIFGPIKAKA